MKRQVTIIELVISISGIAGLVITAWVGINSRLSIVETEIKNNKEQMQEIKLDLKEIKSTTTDILFHQLQTKQIIK